MPEISAGGVELVARFEGDAAPRTVAAFRRLVPLESRIIHVRWSGEGGWIPFGDLDIGIGPENATCYPNPGDEVPARRSWGDVVATSGTVPDSVPDVRTIVRGSGTGASRAGGTTSQ